MSELVQQWLDPKPLWDEVRALLEANEAANNLMIGVLKQLAKQPRKDAFVASAHSKGEVRQLCLWTPPYNMLIWGKGDVSALVHHVHTCGLRPPGVLGESSLAKMFAEKWSGLESIHFQAGLKQRIFECRRATPPGSIPPGAMSVSTSFHRELLTEWLTSFHEECRLSTPVETTVNSIISVVDEGQLYLWVVDRRPVAMAASTRGTERGRGINGVYTPPEFRRHGFAGQLTYTMTQKFFDEGKEYCYLFTDLANPISNSIYQKIGYRPVCDYDEYRFIEAPRTFP